MIIAYAPLSGAQLADLVDVARSETEGEGLNDFLDMAGLNVEDAASFVRELEEVTAG